MTLRPLSQLLLDIQAHFAGQDSVSVAGLLEAFHERGFGFFLFIFALPAALPVPAVGVGTVLALPLLFLTAQQAIGRRTIWLPAWLKAKSLSKTRLDTIITKSLPWMARIEVLVRPRLAWVTQDGMSKFLSVFGLIMAVAVLFPIPLTNTVPSLGIALMGIGILMRDGLAVLAGILIGVAWIVLLIAIVVIFGPEGIDLIKDMIKSVF